MRVIAGFAMVVVTDDEVENSQHGDEDNKIVYELHTEIAHCVEALQYAIYDAHEQRCNLLLLVDATTNPGLPMPAVRVAHAGQAV